MSALGSCLLVTVNGPMDTDDFCMLHVELGDRFFA